MRAAVLALAILALAGCATSGDPHPAVQVKVVQERVIVPVPCVNAGDIAPEPAHVASELTGQARHDLEVVDRSALELRTWGKGLQVQLLACAQPRK